MLLHDDPEHVRRVTSRGDIQTSPREILQSGDYSRRNIQCNSTESGSDSWLSRNQSHRTPTEDVNVCQLVLDKEVHTWKDEGKGTKIKTCVARVRYRLKKNRIEAPEAGAAIQNNVTSLQNVRR